jgi:hypothetical protein
VKRPPPASVFAGALVAIIGVVALAGWAFDAMVLKSVVPGLPEMQPPTALALVFMGRTRVVEAANGCRGSPGKRLADDCR